MGVRITGTDTLVGALNKRATLKDVKNVVKLNGSELQRSMQRNAVFTRGYSTGATKRSIQLKISDNGFTAKIGPTTEYASYPEYGTRYAPAQPYVRPSYFKQKPKFLNDMKRLMK
ncbi:HK97-gp10 family putative phage morphogenesis protein [Shouchella clausii]|uniref:HK97 gp10 family phage protein n=1 Tax=Shouchella clausii TaxID=79880 RepID=A0A268P5H5_SHOCL|nr:HK97-gp10 family putative phage morphogenesis protein [Shouchella clausii]PAE90938.1 hypothetical protein CHH72_00525 [Shouchella clausii]